MVNRKKIISCGCVGKEKLRKLGLKKGKEKGSYRHGMFGTRFYRIYHSMVARTKDNPKNSACRFYGCCGIRNDWKSFDDFYNDMYESYLEHCKKFSEKDTTINRKNSLKNYNKENCHWATRLEQGGDRKNNNLITINGETKRLMEWERILKINRKKIKRDYAIIKTGGAKLNITK